MATAPKVKYFLYVVVGDTDDAVEHCIDNIAELASDWRECMEGDEHTQVVAANFDSDSLVDLVKHVPEVAPDLLAELEEWKS